MSSRTTYDDFGIPRITADDVAELAFAQGLEMAGSRAAQLELVRLRSEGRTAEHLGRAGLEWDRFARRARLDAIAQRGWDRLDEETREFLVAFTDGINSAFAERRWMPWTPMGVFLVQQVQFGSYPHKLWRQRVADVLGTDGLRALSPAPPTPSGSNVYAVTGDRTDTGAPIIAGDPHRILEAPNVYLQTRLTCPEFDVVGFCFPGVPGVQHFAHTGSAAWGLTNAMGDYQDLYAEELRRLPDGTVEAHGPDGWAPASVHVEEIAVRDEEGFEEDEPEQVEVIVTERGPIIFEGATPSEGISLRTASHDLGDLGFAALLPLLRARTVADVEAALEHWVEPVNNWVIADSTGQVVHRVAGRVPERNDANRFGIVPASSADHQWTGWVTDLPVLGPDAAGRVVSANDRTDESFRVVASHFADPSRARRIAELVDTTPVVTAENAIAPLLDIRQLGGNALLAAVAGLEGLGPAAAGLQLVLGAWDREMGVESAGAAVFTAVRAELVARTATAPALAGLVGSVGEATYGQLHAPWLDLAARIADSLPRLFAHGSAIGLDMPGLLRDALEHVAGLPITPWGERHRFTPLTGMAQFGLRDAGRDTSGTGPTGTPLPGDSDCVAVTAWQPGSDGCVRGPVARYAWDLGDRSRSRWAVPLGAHGSPGHPHQGDQFNAWLSGELLPIPPEVEPHAKHCS